MRKDRADQTQAPHRSTQRGELQHTQSSTRPSPGLFRADRSSSQACRLGGKRPPLSKRGKAATAAPRETGKDATAGRTEPGRAGRPPAAATPSGAGVGEKRKAAGGSAGSTHLSGRRRGGLHGGDVPLHFGLRAPHHGAAAGAAPGLPHSLQAERLPGRPSRGAFGKEGGSDERTRRPLVRYASSRATVQSTRLRRVRKSRPTPYPRVRPLPITARSGEGGASAGTALCACAEALYVRGLRRSAQSLQGGGSGTWFPAGRSRWRGVRAALFPSLREPAR